MEMLSISSFDDNDDDSSLLPLFKTMQSKRYFEEDDDDDDKNDNSSEIASLFLGSFLLFSRKSKWEHQQFSWFAQVEKLQHENIFSQINRMSFHDFKVLVDMLYENISYDYARYEFTSTQMPIRAEITVAIGLCWFAGASCVDLKNIYCCSASSFYRHRHQFICALNLCDSLKLSFPSTPKEVHYTQLGFHIVSTTNIIYGCVGAIDGLLVVIKCPSMKDSENNPSSYYSGHYCCHGLNIQAVVMPFVASYFMLLLHLESHLIKLP